MHESKSRVFNRGLTPPSSGRPSAAAHVERWASQLPPRASEASQ